MNLKETNEKLQDFWNASFQGLAPMVFSTENVKNECNFDDCLKTVGDKCERILDFGTGFGFCLLTAAILGEKVKYGLGLDTSKNAIDFINESAKLSNLNTIEAKVGGLEELIALEDNSFDGIICSNVLDVIPEVTTDKIIEQLKRILKPNGILLLKFNFYLTKEIIEKIQMVEVEPNHYTKDGILRGVNHTTEEWISKFEGFTTEKIDSFERIPNGPKDRIIMLKKN